MPTSVLPPRSNIPMHARGPVGGGYWIFACSVAASLLAAEYLGPVIAIVLGVFAISAGALSVRGLIVPPAPMALCWLVGILVIGLASSVVANVTGTTIELINLERDVGIIVSYIVFLVGGYFFAYNKSTQRLGLLVLVLVGTVISVVHMIQFGIAVSGHVSNLYLFRVSTGRGSVAQYAGLFACAVLLGDSALGKFKSPLRLVGGILTISILLTLSRGLIIDVLILGIVVTGFSVRRSGRLVLDAFNLIRFAVVLTLSVVAVYFVLQWMFPAAFNFLSNVFFTKLMNSFTEVSISNLETRRQIADNYRAFELEHVISTFNDRSAFAQWFGQGWGSTLKFGLETAGSKSEFSRTEAPFLHNGYAYYAMKTGIAGLGLYLCFIVHLAVRAVSPKAWGEDPAVVIQRKVLLSSAIAIAVDTVASGGLGFPVSYLCVIFLVGVCYGPVWGAHDADSEVPSMSTARPSPLLSTTADSKISGRRLGGDDLVE
jgi:hypothetical protein